MPRTPLQLVLKDSTETIETYPPVLAQASGTPTVRIGTPSTALPTAESNATNDTTSLTINTAATEGATSLTIDSGSFVANRRYLIIDSTTGRVFPVRAARTTTGTTFPLRQPLPMDIGASSLIKGWRISVALTSAQTSSIGRGVAWWTASLDPGSTGTSVSEEWQTPFRIVERDGLYTLGADTLTESSPYVTNRRPDDDDDYSEVIDAAWRLYVRPAILAKDLRPELIVSGTELEPVHIAACEHHVAATYEGDPTIRAEKKAAFVEQMNLVLNSRELWVIDDSEVLNPPDEDKPRPWTVVRVTR